VKEKTKIRIASCYSLAVFVMNFILITYELSLGLLLVYVFSVFMVCLSAIESDNPAFKFATWMSLFYSISAIAISYPLIEGNSSEFDSRYADIVRGFGVVLTIWSLWLHYHCHKEIIKAMK